MVNKDDTFFKIFKEQKEFQLKNYDPSSLNFEEKIKYTKEFILAAHKELSEVLDTIPWKTHRKEKKEILKGNITEEIIDVLKYVLNLAIVWEIDIDTIINEFFRKSAVVNQRFNQEILQTITEKDLVCAIDLDDTLCNSDEFFTKLFNEKNNTSFFNRNDIKNNTDILEYEKFKSWYRESGEKINIPIKEGAKELCDYLKKEGYKIVIISSRPYKIHSRIYSDTMTWLSKNKINYDALYFEENKHIKILETIPNINFIIEDNYEYASKIADVKYKVYLLTKDKTIPESKYIHKISKLLDIKEHIEIAKTL